MAKEGGETSVDKEKDSQDCITTTIVEDSQNSLQLDSNPGSSFLKAANSGVVDNLQGNLYALAWGNCLPMATSGQFDIIYSEKVREHDKSVDVYGLLEASFDQMDQENKTPQSQKYSSSKCNAEFRYKCGKSRLIDSKFPMLHRQ
ncbi:DNA-directed RNA polymerase IV subunit [Trifolium repens]|nr:DNA-directed RNA polymerase IV subunit [Trifolium repens]